MPTGSMPCADQYHLASPGLFFWQAYDPLSRVDLTTTALATTHGFILIDPIPLTPPLLAELFHAQPPIAIVLTNGNHSRAAAEYRRQFSLPIFAHPDAHPHLEFPVDHLLTDAEVLWDSLTIITLPGAAPGEVAILSPHGLHLGDALIHLPSTGLAILPDQYCENASTLRSSLEKLLRFSFEILTFAHGPPILIQPRNRLAHLLA